MKRSYKVKFRLDEILVEVSGISGRNEYGDSSLAQAIENARRLCLMSFTKEYRGMKIELLDGAPRVVGVETSDAWPS